MINDEKLYILKSIKNESNEINYVEKTIKYSNYYYLLEVNDNLFIAVSNNEKNNIIEFYDSNEYNFISSINLKKSDKIIGYENINNSILCLNINKEKFLLIDIINYEIINIIESNFSKGELIKIKENYFMEFSVRSNIAKIKCFKDGIFDELFTNNFKIDEDNNKIRYKNDGLIFLDKNNMKIITI